MHRRKIYKRLSFFLDRRGLQTVVILIGYALVAPFLPTVIHRLFYTISLLIKDILVWMMPVTVCFFVAQTITLFERKAPLFILTLVLFETVSNLSSVWYALGFARIISETMTPLKVTTLDLSFHALWRLPWPKPPWWAADKGCVVGFLLGAMGGFFRYPSLNRAIDYIKSTLEIILTQVFARLIPLFILGFVARMYQTQLLSQMIYRYGIVLIWLVFVLGLYILGLFALGAGGRWSVMRRHIVNLLPAGGIAFSSGCSLSTMPWTINGTAKNLDHPDMAKAIIPATTNIQQVGDCITNVFLCLLIYRYFYGDVPNYLMLLNFSIVFVLARFATTAVIGGAIFVMLPIYETYLHFTAEMVAIILAFNVILDPLVTSSNVLANGALCRLFEQIWGKLSILRGKDLHQEVKTEG